MTVSNTYSGTRRFYSDDVAHRADPMPPDGFVVVFDPERIFRRGASFEREEICHGLYNDCWPVGLVVRDLRDSLRYRVVKYSTPRRVRQRLVALGGDAELVPRGNNGSLRRIILV